MAKWNRRQFLSGLMTAVGAEAAVAAEAHARPVANLASSPVTAPERAVPPVASRRFAADGERPLDAILSDDLSFGRWRIVAVHPVKHGAIPVVVATRNGDRFQVDILARDRRPGGRRGVAQTRHYALHLANVGRGSKPTREEHGLGVIWLAALLRARESAVSPVALLTLRERIVRHPTGRFDVLASDGDRSASPSAWGPVRTASNAAPALASAAAATALPAQPAVPGLPGSRQG